MKGQPYGVVRCAFQLGPQPCTEGRSMKRCGDRNSAPRLATVMLAASKCTHMHAVVVARYDS